MDASTGTATTRYSLKDHLSRKTGIFKVVIYLPFSRHLGLHEEQAQFLVYQEAI